jgi:hypothetical protein
MSGNIAGAAAKIGVSAWAAGSLLQMLKSATPGGENSVIQSFESGYDKVMFAMGLGMVSGALGAGRFRGSEWADRFPKIMETIPAIPRAGMISLLEGWVDSDPERQAQTEFVLQKMMESPDYFGEEIATELNSAFEEGRFQESVEKLFLDNSGLREEMFKQQPPVLDRQNGEN